MKAGKKNIIGPRVRRHRRAAGLSVEELAVRTGLDVTGIEAGARRVLDDEVLVLARALGVTVDALFPTSRR